MVLKNKFYAVANGRAIGIFLNWDDCHNSVTGYKNASYKKFDNKEEAENFVISSSPNFFVSPILIFISEVFAVILSRPINLIAL